MQTLERDGLTRAQVERIVRASSLEVRSGLERLSSGLVVLEDVSDDLVGGDLERSMAATIHGTCRLRVARAFAWGTDLLRPYMVIGDGLRSCRVNLGVYVLTTPDLRVGRTPVEYEVTGFDRLYLLDRAVGDSYSVPAGTGVLAAVRAAIAAAGLSGVLLDGSAESSTVPVTTTWPIVGEGGQGGPTRWLRIVNDLLALVNYRGLRADENGLFRSEPYASPATRPVEFEFRADTELTIVGEERRLVEDVYRQPNKWVFVQRNRTTAPAEGAGQYTVTNSSDGPSSIASRGLTWTEVVEVDAADHAALVSIGNARVAADRRVASRLEVTTGPFPFAGHADVFTYADPGLGGTRKVQAERWSFSLDGSDVSWTWETVSTS